MPSIFSKLSTPTLIIAAGVCFATTVAIVYVLTKEDEPYEHYLKAARDEIYSSRHSVIEVAVPTALVGGIIGRQGSNIKQIQERTNTTICFKDQISGDDERIAVICGKPHDAQKAESLIRNEMAEMRKVTTVTIMIPSSACGNIIGKNGNNIRMINDVSKAKVDIERCYDGGTSATNRRVYIKGTESQIEMAKALIEEAVTEAEIRDKRGGNKRLFLTDHDQEASKSSEPKTENLVSTTRDGYIEVFVSVVDSPSRFWVQPLGVKAKELDKLISDMTDYYDDESNAARHQILETIEVGTLMAAPFEFDDTWYRVVVTSIEEEDEYDPSESIVHVFYVDFGGESTMKRKQIFSLHSQFRSLAFQAIECSLHNIEPKGGGNIWTKEGISQFEKLTSNGQWELIMLKVVRGQEEKVKQVELVDTRGLNDIRVAEEMVANGFGQWIQSE